MFNLIHLHGKRWLPTFSSLIGVRSAWSVSYSLTGLRSVASINLNEISDQYSNCPSAVYAAWGLDIRILISTTVPPTIIRYAASKIINRSATGSWFLLNINHRKSKVKYCNNSLHSICTKHKAEWGYSSWKLAWPNNRFLVNARYGVVRHQTSSHVLAIVSLK